MMSEPPPLMKECPFCAESIKAKAKKCRFCGETIDVVLRVAEEAKNRPNVYMNAGGGGGGASAAAVGGETRKNFPHVIHLLLAVFSGGLWLPIWILLFLTRNRSRYF